MTPEATARLAAETMWAGDHASQHLNMQLLEASPGRAVLSMEVQPFMLNGHKTAHGGFIFTLADSAFAYACNSHGITTVAAQCQVTFLRPARRGDVMRAEARVIAEGDVIAPSARIEAMYEPDKFGLSATQRVRTLPSLGGKQVAEK